MLLINPFLMIRSHKTRGRSDWGQALLQLESTRGISDDASDSTGALLTRRWFHGLAPGRLKYLLRLSNWPFALKMSFGPALGMAVLVGMGLHGILATAEQAALINEVVHQDLT